MNCLLIKLARFNMKMYCFIMSYVVGEKITDDDIYKAMLSSRRLHNRP